LEVAWISFQKDTGVRSSEGIGIEDLKARVLKGKARISRGEIDNYKEAGLAEN
jgi:hypothetical protein